MQWAFYGQQEHVGDSSFAGNQNLSRHLPTGHLPSVPSTANPPFLQPIETSHLFNLNRLVDSAAAAAAVTSCTDNKHTTAIVTLLHGKFC